MKLIHRSITGDLEWTPILGIHWPLQTKVSPRLSLGHSLSLVWAKRRESLGTKLPKWISLISRRSARK